MCLYNKLLFNGVSTSGGEADLGAPSGGAVTANAVTEGVSLVFRTLPQSKIGSEGPIFDSPLSEGAEIAPLRGVRADGIIMAQGQRQAVIFPAQG